MSKLLIGAIAFTGGVLITVRALSRAAAGAEPDAADKLVDTIGKYLGPLVATQPATPEPATPAAGSGTGGAGGLPPPPSQPGAATGANQLMTGSNQYTKPTAPLPPTGGASPPSGSVTTTKQEAGGYERLAGRRVSS